MKADETLLQALKKAFSIGKIYGQVFEGIDSTDQTAAESKKLEFERLCEATIRNLSSCDLQHSDDEAVDKFAQAMKQKLAQAREKGRSGWEQMNPADISAMLREHVEKGDPRDVANFCMFLWNLGQPITPCKPIQAEPVAWVRRHPDGALTAEFLEDAVIEPARKKSGAWVPLYNHPAPAVMQEPVHFRAVICKEQQEQALGVVPKIVGFVDKKAAEQFILEKRDFQGWKYNLEPLYDEAPAVAQSWELNEETAKFLADLILANDEPTPVTLSVGFIKDDDGKIQHGLRVHESEYPEEGAELLVESTPSPQKAPPADVVRELVEALNDFSNYVHAEQSSTDGHVQYSNTQINRLAFKARSALKSAKEHGL
ncbi:hypothetical protein [Limnobacter sp.]|uniref:hypothetical protein n=1 Tax=Limnobacter sp. TaxID=2003368 RepID=UPI00311D4545